MERSEILATMGELKLYGMKAAFDADSDEVAQAFRDIVAH